jgi:uncharacterized protein (TIGR02145 family)
MNETFNRYLIVTAISAAILSGCKKENVVTLSTTSVTNITETTATSGGTIVKGGGSALKSYGVCWSTSQNPTVNDSNSKDSLRPGIEWFSCKLIRLMPNTLYHVRAYAVYNAEPLYGNDISFTTQNYGVVTDIDGNLYKTLPFGTQTWMVENLKTTRFRNGDLIGTTTPATLDITSSTTPEYQWSLNGNESSVAAYGRYYTFYVVKDSRNICPSGWHVPSVNEWWQLIQYLMNTGYGYGGDEFKIAKSMASGSGWTTDLTPGNVGNMQENNNNSSFTAIPSGCRNYNGQFADKGNFCLIWTSVESSSNDSNVFGLAFDENVMFLSTLRKSFGFSVRCLKD